MKRQTWIFLVVTLTLGGCAGISGEITPEPRDDAIIATKIKAQLIDSQQLAAAAIKVESDGGAVTLSGFVDNEDQSRKAESLARSVDGVVNVTNQLDVK